MTMETSEKNSLEEANKIWYNYNVNGTLNSEKTEKFRSDKTVTFTSKYDKTSQLTSFEFKNSENLTPEEKTVKAKISKGDNRYEVN